MSDSFPDRWVRIMCDYSADAVWNSSGESCDADRLPVSDALRDELRKWQAVWDEHYTPVHRNTDYDWRGFSAWGLVLARRVKAELPDWTVLYFDEWASSRMPRNWGEGDRIRFEYPV